MFTFTKYTSISFLMDFLSRNRFISLKVWHIKTAYFQSAKTTQQGGSCLQHRRATYNPGQQWASRVCTGRLQEFSALVTNCLTALQQKKGRVLHRTCLHTSGFSMLVQPIQQKSITTSDASISEHTHLKSVKIY